MIKNGLDIQTTSTKRTDFKTDSVLLLGQVTEGKEKADPSQFFQHTNENNIVNEKT